MNINNVHFIVVAKFLGMGSIIQATPLLRTLKHAYPDARLCFITTSQNRYIVERLALVDERLYVDDSGPWALTWSSLRVLARLVRRKIDLYFDLEVYSAYSCCMALCAVARNRFGYYRYSSRFKQGIYTHLVYFNTRRPVRKIYTQLAAAAGIREADIASELAPLTIWISERDSLRAKCVSMGFPMGEIQSPYVVINPNASDLLLERRWPLERFALVGLRLAESGVLVIVTGSPTEQEHASQLVNMIGCPEPNRVFNVAGRLTFGEFLALLEGANCVITNDTGPFHIALALNRPVVGLFGPVDPGHYGIRRPNVNLLFKSIYCSPCLHELDEPACNGNNFCMHAIRPAEVIRAAGELLAAQGYQLNALECTTTDSSQDEAYWDGQRKPLGVIVRSSIPFVGD